MCQSEVLTSGSAHGTMGPVPTACTAAIRHHFFPSTPGTQGQDLAWSTVLSTVLSVHVLAGQMLKECVGAYVEQVTCPEIRDKGSRSFYSTFQTQGNLECFTEGQKEGHKQTF
uniref:Uncharacterized protein n=1 Tax=Oreochromis niloticus TaxID=8128 RepID=A0A669DT40_ORENI